MSSSECCCMMLCLKSFCCCCSSDDKIDKDSSFITLVNEEGKAEPNDSGVSPPPTIMIPKTVVESPTPIMTLEDSMELVSVESSDVPPDTDCDEEYDTMETYVPKGDPVDEHVPEYYYYESEAPSVASLSEIDEGEEILYETVKKEQKAEEANEYENVYTYTSTTNGSASKSGTKSSANSSKQSATASKANSATKSAINSSANSAKQSATASKVNSASQPATTTSAANSANNSASYSVTKSKNYSPRLSAASSPVSSAKYSAPQSATESVKVSAPQSTVNSAKSIEHAIQYEVDEDQVAAIKESSAYLAMVNSDMKIVDLADDLEAKTEADDKAEHDYMMVMDRAQSP